MARKPGKILKCVIFSGVLLLLFYTFHFKAERDGVHIDQPVLPSNESEISREETEQKPATLRDLVHTIPAMLDVPCDVSGLSKYGREIRLDIKEFAADGKRPATSKQLRKYLKVSKKEIRNLREIHNEVLKHLPQQMAPDQVRGNGIVMTADGYHFVSALINIKWIRSINANIPIELHISEVYLWEASYCDSILRDMNVKCICQEIMYGALYEKMKASGYVNKALALLGSSFENIYYTDADSLMLEDVEKLFDEPLYNQYGMIFNADFWPRTTSPYFYDITNISLGPDVVNGTRLLQIDRENAIPGMATESGQMFIKKSQHFKSLALSTYYNLRSNIWWPLLSQRAPGQGDKEVWPAAAHVTGEPWYQTYGDPFKLGPLDEKKDEIQFFAWLQPNFQRDYEIFHDKRTDIPPVYSALHFQTLKLNMAKIMDRYHNEIPKNRFLGSLSTVQKTLNREDDIELEIWTLMRDMACDWALGQHKVPTDWMPGNVDSYCESAKAQVAWLKENPEISRPVASSY